MPRVIRDEVNRRLADGQTSKSILDWLNNLPAACQILRDQFDAAPITESNLSDWRNGGFRESQQENQRQNNIQIILDAHPALIASVQGDLSDRIAVLFAAHMISELRELALEKDTENKALLWRELRMGLAAMRRYAYFTAKHRAEFGKLEHERLEREQRKSPLTAEEQEQRVNQVLGIRIDDARWDEEKQCYVGEGAEALNEQRRKIMSGELYADKPVFEEWRHDGVHPSDEADRAKSC
jgi:hypothetical protein